ncbi:hypothetical protein Taro_049383 [Colocasia esculenta]|uniref:Uncharacterized protein n=1 Tax=Colocasia esculenta TaxID=4460 RepID=A0A843XAS4_COLES|nr:hypothetical protein [Colocasia esculenta]
MFVVKGVHRGEIAKGVAAEGRSRRGVRREGGSPRRGRGFHREGEGGSLRRGFLVFLVFLAARFRHHLCEGGSLRFCLSEITQILLRRGFLVFLAARFRHHLCEGGSLRFCLSEITQEMNCAFFMWCDKVRSFVETTTTCEKDEKIKKLEDRIVWLEDELRDSKSLINKAKGVVQSLPKTFTFLSILDKDGDDGSDGDSHS